MLATNQLESIPDLKRASSRFCVAPLAMEGHCYRRAANAIYRHIDA